MGNAVLGQLSGLFFQLNSLLDGMYVGSHGKVDIKGVGTGDAQKEKPVSADHPSVGILHMALHHIGVDGMGCVDLKGAQEKLGWDRAGFLASVGSCLPVPKSLEVL